MEIGAMSKTSALLLSRERENCVSSAREQQFTLNKITLVAEITLRLLTLFRRGIKRLKHKYARLFIGEISKN